MAPIRLFGQERSEARCRASTLGSGSAAAAEDGSGERRDEPEGPFGPTEGRVRLRRGVGAPRARGGRVAGVTGDRSRAIAVWKGMA